MVGVEFLKPNPALRLDGLRLYGAPRAEVLAALHAVDHDVWDDGEGYVFRGLGLAMAASRGYRKNPAIFVAGPGTYTDEELEDLEYGPITGAPK